MATLHAEDGRVRAYVKGAPDVLLARCRFVDDPDGPEPLDDRGRARILDQARSLARRGLRVIAGATTVLDDTGADPEELDGRLTGLTPVGLVGAAIARDIGTGGDVVTGADLDRMDEAELGRRIDKIGVFARVAPEHKTAIITALTNTAT
jgi:Ca2+-transporting ATPase